STTMLPSLGRVSRLMVRTSVLLPAPLRPMMPNTSPAGIDRLTLCSASIQPRGPANRWEILRISIMEKRNGGDCQRALCAPDKRPPLLLLGFEALILPPRRHS